MRRYASKTRVVKYGGSAMGERTADRELAVLPFRPSGRLCQNKCETPSCWGATAGVASPEAIFQRLVCMVSGLPPPERPIGAGRPGVGPRNDHFCAKPVGAEREIS